MDTEISPIVKTIEIAAPRAVVFDIFTTRLADWWPLARFSRVRGAAPLTAVLEPRVDGDIYEVSATGDRLSWGTVVAYEPPTRLVMHWHLGRPVSTTVEVEFESIGAQRTRVRLVHGGWELLEALGATVERQAYEQGWGLILEQCFAVFVTREVAA
jgi:uncharacterized protein YndB with AHSA1/START domain